MKFIETFNKSIHIQKRDFFSWYPRGLKEIYKVALDGNLNRNFENHTDPRK